MKILFIGDIVGRPGRETVKKMVKDIKEKNQIDFVIANAENAHHGKGVTEENIKELQAAGVDFFTSGNHIWNEKSIIPFLGIDGLPLIRPANYPAGTPGMGRKIAIKDGKRILVINLLGRLFMNVQLDCPFKKIDEILIESENEKLDAIFVDFHAETTSEKVAMGRYLDGRVTAMIGTHTHVATADAQIFPKGTAFQTDVGFVGPADSVIGVKKELIIRHFLTSLPVKHELAEGPTAFNGVIIGTDDKTRLAVSIEPVQYRLE